MAMAKLAPHGIHSPIDLRPGSSGMPTAVVPPSCQTLMGIPL